MHLTVWANDTAFVTKTESTPGAPTLLAGALSAHQLSATPLAIRPTGRLSYVRDKGVTYTSSLLAQEVAGPVSGLFSRYQVFAIARGLG